ncbi:MAG: cupin domain-containing protein [Alphaproteobacteria bacterium]
MTPAWLIDRLGMHPHPEGGHYVETFRDAPESGARGAVTCIHFLLQAGEVSAWHRIDATEIWHFAAGDPLVLTLSADGHDAEAKHLGVDLAAGQSPHIVLPPACWQTAETLGRWSLVSCIVAPAFAFDGFEMAPPGWRPTPRPAAGQVGLPAQGST